MKLFMDNQKTIKNLILTSHTRKRMTQRSIRKHEIVRTFLKGECTLSRGIYISKKKHYVVVFKKIDNTVKIITVYYSPAFYLAAKELQRIKKCNKEDSLRKLRRNKNKLVESIRKQFGITFNNSDWETV